MVDFTVVYIRVILVLHFLHLVSLANVSVSSNVLVRPCTEGCSHKQNKARTAKLIQHTSENTIWGKNGKYNLGQPLFSGPRPPNPIFWSRGRSPDFGNVP